MDNEVVDVVDGRDMVIGTSTLKECLSRGLLHRAVAVIVERQRGRFLLQQRSSSDIWQPGLWTLSCTGHVRRHESYPAAARRELAEELGLRAHVNTIAKALLPAVTSGGLTEREWVRLFVARSDARVIIDPKELERVKEFSVTELRRMVRLGPLTEDARLLLALFLESR
ncbi:MAG: NUDIX domain-containing protein [Thaumarchaeota archaeon]|nr:NUDIX domain-containing protein [Nitrososphaerota archaeon]